MEQQTLTAQHAPGPWELDDGGDGELQIWSPSARDDRTIVQVGDLEATAEDRANARLIAAAPEYAELSERLHMEINGLHATLRATSADYRNSELCRQMDALIRDNAEVLAKARA